MAYRFRSDDPSVVKGLRRIALSQLDKAIAVAGETPEDVHAAVHDVRKRCKKLRGLIRLVRPAFKAYKTENADFRDAARELSRLRDSRALIETYDALADHFDDQIDRRAVGPIRRQLTMRQRDLTDAADASEKLAAFRQTMIEARDRAAEWKLKGEGFAVMFGGLEQTFERARDAMEKARAEPSDEAFHEWRKRVKYHTYHARLLQDIWPHGMSSHRNAGEALDDLLGGHRDLATFRDALAADPGAFGRSESVEMMLGLAARRRETLAGEAIALGARFLAEHPEALAKRWRRWWEAWRSEAGH